MNTFKKKMKEKIKIFSNDQYLDGYIKNEFLTDDGDADIFLKLHNKSELFDERTVGHQKELLNSVYEYIEDKTSVLSSSVKIHLHFIGVELNSREQGIARHILKEHYAIELFKIQKEYSKYRNKIIGLIIIGFLCLIAYLLLYLNTDFNFFLEVFGFLFSFSLWEAFDCYLYTFSDIKETRIAITQNLLMDVDFYENNMHNNKP